MWSYAAPIGNGLTNFLALRNYQHVRFISGVATLPSIDPVVIDLKDYIATGSFDDFKAKDHFTAAVPRTNGYGVTALLVEGNSKLELTLNKPLETGDAPVAVVPSTTTFERLRKPSF